ncbi:MAG TPA: hypothetical protein VF777_12625 [Phycisphaerales bacterium]
MTYGGHYGKKAKGAINRFYEHADTRHLATLQEAASELYLAESQKAKDKLWAKVDLALGHLTQGDLRLDSKKAMAVVESKSVEKLAALIAEIGAKK